MKFSEIVAIYKITSPSNRIYIGQTRNLSKRISSYRRLKKPGQPKLFYSIKKYGFESHTVEVVHKLPIDVTQSVLNEYEELYMDLYKNANFDLLNVKAAGSRGKHSLETIEKIKKNNARPMLGKNMSEDAKERIRQAHFGMGHSEITKQRLREASTGNKNCLGRPVPKDVREKIKKSLTGRKSSPQAIQNAIDGRKGYVHSELTKQKLRESNLGQKRSEESRLKMRNSQLGKKQSPESIEKRKNALGKIILNMQTGIFYVGALDAAQSEGMVVSTLRSKLNGGAKNNTYFLHV